MKSEYKLKLAAVSAVLEMSFEDRDHFVRTHRYDKSNSNHMVLWTDGLKRDQVIGRYLPHYTLDNLYEYCVFRNLITLLNKYARLLHKDGSPTKRAFTLGHWKPLKRGGIHHAANWVIQTNKDNQAAGDNLPAQPEKWTAKEQVEYIMAHINFNFVDAKYLKPMQKYITMLGKCYHGKTEKDTGLSPISSEFCAQAHG